MAHLLTRTETEMDELIWIETIWNHAIQRVFWIYKVPQASLRGGHRHHSCLMVLHCISGSVDIYVQTPTEDQYFTLNSPNQYLFLDPRDWRIMHKFSSNAVLTVFASKPYATTLYFEEPYRHPVYNR